MPRTDVINRKSLPQLSENPLKIVPCDADVVLAEGIVVIDFSRGGMNSRKQFRGVPGAEVVVAECVVIDGWKLLYNTGSGRLFVPANQNGNPVRDFIGGSTKDCVAEIIDRGPAVDLSSEGGLRSIAYQLTRNDITVSAVDFIDETIADIDSAIAQRVIAEFDQVETTAPNPVQRNITTTQIAILLALAAAIGFGAVAAVKHSRNTTAAIDTSTAP